MDSINNMDLNLLAFGYLFLRLAPFILVCFFTLSSIFNQDFKGFIYLAGVLLSAVFYMMVSKTFGFQRPENYPEVCNFLLLDTSGESFNLPLGTNMLTFTFAYLLHGMNTNGVIQQNSFTFLFFVMLIGLDTLWNKMNSCYSLGQLGLSAALGMFAGSLWGSILTKSKANNLLYFSGLSTKDVCSRPSKQTFKCEVYKNGKKIATKMSG